ncbi:MAG: hypothetical protein BroJett015_21780 [Chloroflexota bacterium]|nr:MAG: hypothetical protein BroJett015_21780 [Chloroflexota bacterium]
MKPMTFSFILLFSLLLAGCGVEGETATAVSTALSTAVPTRVAVVANTAVPTATQIPATDTAVASPTNTATSLPATAVPTETLTNTPTPLPPPPRGDIVFLWSPYPQPDGSDPSLTTNFYIASPEESIEDWHIEPVITNLFGSPLMRISPDFSHAAILFAEDEELAFNEIRRISAYDFRDNGIQNLTDNQCCLYNFTWQPDGQAVIYSQVHDLFVVSLNNAPTEQLTFRNSLSPDSEIFNPVISPDGLRLAMTTSNPNSLVLYNLTNGEHFVTGEVSYPSSYLTTVWSPDSQWLAFTSNFNQGLSLVNAESRDTIQLAGASSRCFPAWSASGLKLAFTCDNTIYLWDGSTQTIVELVKAEILGPPAWAPNNSLLAASFTNGDKTGLLLVDPVEGSTYELYLNSHIRPAVWAAPIWSPDTGWLLVLSEPAEHDARSGIYLVNRLTGIPYLMMDTTGLQRPYGFTWLLAD